MKLEVGRCIFVWRYEVSWVVFFFLFFSFSCMSSTGSLCSRNKIQVTREQIADQHAYRLHLRHTEASPEIQQQEKLVEDQLIKREASAGLLLSLSDSGLSFPVLSCRWLVAWWG